MSIVGALFKITHWSFGPISGNIILVIGSIFQISGIILLLYKLFTSPKFKEFLNR
ncbi:GldL-related protein [Chryseobacterium sp. T1]